MRKIITVLLLLVSCKLFSQKNVDIRIENIIPTSIPAYNAFDANDNGERGIEVRFDLRMCALRKKIFVFKLKIDGSGSKSAPEIVNPKIVFLPQDFKAKSKAVTLKLKLKPVECLKVAEKIKLIADAKDTKHGITEKELTILPISSNDNPNVKILPGSVVVPPYYSSSKRDDGIRDIIIEAVISGKKNDEAPYPFILSAAVKKSNDNLFTVIGNPTLTKEVFSADGCHKKVNLNVRLKLEKIDSFSREEEFELLLNGSTTTSFKVQLKPDPKKEETPKAADTEKVARFSNACYNGRNFIVHLHPGDKSGKIEVEEEKEKKKYVYTYNTDFRTKDFALWMNNVFIGLSKTNSCSDCGFCVIEIAERTKAELDAMKGVVLADKAKNITQAADSKTLGKDSTVSKTDSAKKTTNTTEAKKKDTVVFNSNLFYSDTSKMKVTITKTPTENTIKLCKTLASGKDTCIKKETAPVLSLETFQTVVKDMASKFYGEAIEPAKFDPQLAELYSNYKSNLEKEQPPSPNPITTAFNGAYDPITKEKDTSLIVGELILKDSVVNVYDIAGDVIKKVKVKSVTVTIENGLISKRLFIVETDGGIFINYQSPVSIFNVGNNKKENNLINIEGEGYIRLNDFMRYKVKYYYFPDDIYDVVLTNKDKSIKLSASASLNSILNVAIFTDLAGLTGRRANGLLNTEVGFSFTPYGKNIRNTSLLMLPNIEFNVRLSKFDSKFRSIDSSNVGINNSNPKDTIDRMQLLQKAWFRGEAKLSVLKLNLFHFQTISVNIGTVFNAVNADSFFRKDADILVFEYYWEAVYAIKKLRNFGADVGVRYTKHQLADKEPFVNIGKQHVFNPRINFYYYPLGTPSNTIYFRYNYYADRLKDAKNFYQIQVGWKTNINFNKK